MVFGWPRWVTFVGESQNEVKNGQKANFHKKSQNFDLGRCK